MKYWLQTPDEIPERHQLTYFLNKIPNVKIPLSKENFSSIPVIGPFSIDPTERDKYFVESKSESCTAFFTGLISSLIDTPPTGKTEDSFHSFWDAIISKSLQVFGKYSNEMPAMDFDRNTSRNTTTGLNRPDFVLLMRNICVIRGEEKGEGGRGEPARELIDKFNTWDYGDTPYLFGYYANTTAVTFCVLYINEKEPININSQKRKCPDICSERLAEFDLNKLTHRFKLMNLIRNICRILPMIINMCPSKELPDFETIIRDNGTNIEIGYDIKKTFPSEAKVKHLENFYGLMSNYKIKCIDKLIRSRNNVVHLMPRGKEKKPKNLNELLRAIICILTCLEGLHNIKPNPVMHRDIRWPNVIQYEDQYILIDFDFASFSPSNENLQNLNPDNHAPEMLIGVHNVTVDIWGVGYLIVSSGINELPEELLSLSQSMCQENINLRPNAFDTLKVVKGFFVKWFPNDDWLNCFDNE
nr:10567_t:CDS:2 [Entrophospora candida]